MEFPSSLPKPKPINQISKEDLLEGVEKDLYKHIYDVRSEEMFTAQTIPGAKRLDKDNMKEIEALEKDTPLVFVCSIGKSSQGACDFYRKKGFTNVNNLIGGVSNWYS